MNGVGAAASTNIVVPILEYSYSVLYFIYTSGMDFSTHASRQQQLQIHFKFRLVFDHPQSPSTQRLRFLVSKAIASTVF